MELGGRERIAHLAVGLMAVYQMVHYILVVHAEHHFAGEYLGLCAVAVAAAVEMGLFFANQESVPSDFVVGGAEAPPLVSSVLAEREEALPIDELVDLSVMAVLLVSGFELSGLAQLETECGMAAVVVDPCVANCPGVLVSENCSEALDLFLDRDEAHNLVQWVAYDLIHALVHVLVHEMTHVLVHEVEHGLVHEVDPDLLHGKSHGLVHVLMEDHDRMHEVVPVCQVVREIYVD